MNSRSLNFNPSNSGLFYCYRDKTAKKTPTSNEFSQAVKKWKIENNVKSLRKYVQNEGSLESFYINPIIGNYISRRKIELDKYDIPVLNKHESSLYWGPKIGIACRFAYEGDAEDKKILAAMKRKTKTILHPFTLFNLRGLFPSESKDILKINLKNLDVLKSMDRIKYNGIHYLNKRIVLNNYKEYTFLNFVDNISGSEPFNIFINDIKAGRLVKFDNCNYNVLLGSLGSEQHAICYAVVVDTKNPRKRKIKEIIGFNSWDQRDKGCPIERIKKLVRTKNIPVRSIYYGAQGGEVNAWDSDGNCVLYSINTMNALLKLLLDKTSLFHKRCFESVELTFKDKLVALKKMKYAFAFALGLACLALELAIISSIRFGTQAGVWTMIVLTALGLVAAKFKLYDTYQELLQKQGSMDKLKEELQRALPQYFNVKNGKAFVKPFDQRKVRHIEDRWLLGNVAVEQMMKG